MTAPMTPEQLAAAEQAIERASIEVGEICKRTGPGRWRMSIPANPDRDSDLIIAAALERGTALAAEVKRLQAEQRDAHHDLQIAVGEKYTTVNSAAFEAARQIAYFRAEIERLKKQLNPSGNWTQTADGRWVPAVPVKPSVGLRISAWLHRRFGVRL